MLKNMFKSVSQKKAPLPEEIRGMDLNHDGKIDKDELQLYIDKNAQLWAMLSVNCNIPESKCQEIARDVAYQMAKLTTMGPFASFKDLVYANREREPTVQEFAQFHDNLQNDPQYSLQFFHRTVFCAYDSDQNGYIENHEIDAFLNVFYDAQSIFAGDMRLPPKAQLKKTLLETFDTNNDGRLEYNELKPLISGGAASFGQEFGSFDEQEEELLTDKFEKEEKEDSSTTKRESRNPYGYEDPSSSSNPDYSSNRGDFSSNHSSNPDFDLPEESDSGHAGDDKVHKKKKKKSHKSKDHHHDDDEKAKKKKKKKKSKDPDAVSVKSDRSGKSEQSGERKKKKKQSRRASLENVSGEKKSRPRLKKKSASSKNTDDLTTSSSSHKKHEKPKRRQSTPFRWWAWWDGW